MSETGIFEIIAEWKIRRLKQLKSLDDRDLVKRWILYSLGLEETAQEIYLYLEKMGSSTSTEIAKALNISPNTARKYLDDLHTVGLTDYIGREYHLTYDSLSKAIELILIPRLTDTLKTIARIARETIDRRKIGIEAQLASERYGEREVLKFFSSMIITRKMVEMWYRLGKKVVIKSFSKLSFEKDIDPQMAEEVIDSIESYGPIYISPQLYSILSYKFKSIGSLKLIE